MYFFQPLHIDTIIWCKSWTLCACWAEAQRSSLVTFVFEGCVSEHPGTAEAMACYVQCKATLTVIDVALFNPAEDAKHLHEAMKGTGEHKTTSFWTLNNMATFCRQYIETHFRERNFFSSNFTEDCSNVSNWQNATCRNGLEDLSVFEYAILLLSI